MATGPLRTFCISFRLAIEIGFEMDFDSILTICRFPRYVESPERPVDFMHLVLLQTVGTLYTGCSTFSELRSFSKSSAKYSSSESVGSVLISISLQVSTFSLEVSMRLVWVSTDPGKTCKLLVIKVMVMLDNRN